MFWVKYAAFNLKPVSYIKLEQIRGYKMAILLLLLYNFKYTNKPLNQHWDTLCILKILRHFDFVEQENFYVSIKGDNSVNILLVKQYYTIRLLVEVDADDAAFKNHSSCN